MFNYIGYNLISTLIPELLKGLLNLKIYENRYTNKKLWAIENTSIIKTMKWGTHFITNKNQGYEFTQLVYIYICVCLKNIKVRDLKG